MKKSKRGFIVVSLLSGAAVLSLFLLMAWHTIDVERKLAFHYEEALYRARFFDSIFEYVSRKISRNFTFFSATLKKTKMCSYDLSKLSTSLSYSACSSIQLFVSKGTLSMCPSCFFIRVRVRCVNEAYEMRWYIIRETSQGKSYDYCDYYTLSTLNE